MFAAAAIAIIITMVLALIRGFIGPTLYDRILAVNMFGTQTVLVIAILGFMMGRPDFLDIALVYALINFVGVIALSVPPPDTVKSPPAGPIIKVLVAVINLIALTWLDAIV